MLYYEITVEHRVALSFADTKVLNFSLRIKSETTFQTNRPILLANQKNVLNFQ